MKYIEFFIVYFSILIPLIITQYYETKNNIQVSIIIQVFSCALIDQLLSYVFLKREWNTLFFGLSLIGYLLTNLLVQGLLPFILPLLNVNLGDLTFLATGYIISDLISTFIATFAFLGLQCLYYKI